MADQSDVEIALVKAITAAIYPNGVTGSPLPNLVGILVDIRRGWPLPATLDIALASGKDVLVRIYPESGMTRNTTRFVPQWRDVTPVPPTLTVSTSGSQVTFGGTGDPSHAAGVIVGSPPNDQPYAYRLQPGDGPVEVAAALAALIGGSTGAYNGVLSILTNLPVAARVVHDQSVFTEVRRQDQGFRISIWSANNSARDAVATAIDNALAWLLDPNGNPTMNLTLASDGSAGWLRYRATYTMDNAQKAGLYRRDLCYLVEYPTSQTAVGPAVLITQENVAAVITTPGATPEVVKTFATYTG